MPVLARRGTGSRHENHRSGHLISPARIVYATSHAVYRDQRMAARISPAERHALGQARRKQLRRQEHAHRRAAVGRISPVTTIARSMRGRIASLVSAEVRTHARVALRFLLRLAAPFWPPTHHRRTPASSRRYLRRCPRAQPRCLRRTGWSPLSSISMTSMNLRRALQLDLKRMAPVSCSQDAKTGRSRPPVATPCTSSLPLPPPRRGARRVCLCWSLPVIQAIASSGSPPSPKPGEGGA